MAASVWQIGRNRDFRGGETQALLPEEVGRNQLIRMENAMIYPSGELTAAHATDTDVITNATLGICVVPYTDGTYNIFSAPDDDTVYGQFFETSAESPIDMLAGSIESVVGARIVGVQKSVRFLGKEYCPNPHTDDTKNGILNLTDFTMINIDCDDAVSFKLRLYSNRLWLIDSLGRLRNSNNGDATTWNALNIMLLANSEPIIDFHPVPGGAIVYSATAIYGMYGTTYEDISFVPLLQSSAQNVKRFTTASVEVAGVVYILSLEGIYQVSLNGAQLLPHHQEVFFKDYHGLFADSAKVIEAGKGVTALPESLNLKIKRHEVAELSISYFTLNCVSSGGTKKVLNLLESCDPEGSDTEGCKLPTSDHALSDPNSSHSDKGANS